MKKSKRRRISQEQRRRK